MRERAASLRLSSPFKSSEKTRVCAEFPLKCAELPLKCAELPFKCAELALDCSELSPNTSSGFGSAATTGATAGRMKTVARSLPLPRLHPGPWKLRRPSGAGLNLDAPALRRGGRVPAKGAALLERRFPFL